MSQEIKAVTIKSATPLILQATLHHTDPKAVAAELERMGSLEMERAPLLIDTSQLTPADVKTADWAALINAFSKVNLCPFALGIDASEVASRLGLAVLGASPGMPPGRQAEAPSPSLENLPAMIVDAPVRSGSVIYAKGRDLIITGAVSVGAEVITDGHLHVYGRLNGRAIAGASGREDARVFALDFQPELVSIAGVYQTFEAGHPEAPAGRLFVVSLASGQLVFKGS